MFGIFKKKAKEIEGKGFKAYVDGRSVDITNVPDEVFSSKMLGDGIAILPSSGEFVSPCDGKITTIMSSGHAIGIETEDGVQILLHIGLDTVTLEGEGFDLHCEAGQQIKTGEPLVTVDLDLIKRKGFKDISMMVLIDLNNHMVTDYHIDSEVTGGKSLLLEYC